MALVFALIGGVSGFLAALATLVLGQGFWQALINYWQVGTVVLLGLVGLQLITIAVRSVGVKIAPHSFSHNRSDVYGFADLKPSPWKGAIASRHRR